MNEIQKRYLKLVKKAVLGELFIQEVALIFLMRKVALGKVQFDPNLLFTYASEFDQHIREVKLILSDGGVGASMLPSFTMIGSKRLDNVENCLLDVIKNNVQGDFLEAGVWRGGCSLFAKAFLITTGQHHRKIWLADSFDGLPIPTNKHDLGVNLSKSERPHYAIPIERVKELFSRFEMLDDNVHFVQGWFRDTLHRIVIEKIAVLRLDGDLFESTMDTLTALYEKVAIGGFIIVDDYFAFDGCKLAVDEFRSVNGISDRIVNIDGSGVFWKKTS